MSKGNSQIKNLQNQTKNNEKTMSSRVIFASCIIAAVQSVRINQSELIDPVEKVMDAYLRPVELPEEENDCCQPFDFCCDDDEMHYDDWVIAAEVTDKIADEIAQEIADEEDLTVEASCREDPHNQNW